MTGYFWRPWPDSNRRIAVLQTAVLTTSPHGQTEEPTESYQNAFVEAKRIRSLALANPKG